MEKNSKTEQQVSEEQLQEITGGCLACEADRLNSSFALQEAQAHDNAAMRSVKVINSTYDENIISNHLNMIKEHKGQATQLRSQAQSFQQRIAARGQH